MDKKIPNLDERATMFCSCMDPGKTCPALADNIEESLDLVYQSRQIITERSETPNKTLTVENHLLMCHVKKWPPQFHGYIAEAPTKLENMEVSSFRRTCGLPCSACANERKGHVISCCLILF